MYRYDAFEVISKHQYLQCVLFYNVYNSTMCIILQCVLFYNVYYSTMCIILQCVLFYNVCYSTHNDNQCVHNKYGAIITRERS
jgi:ADP-glucose pyrophosphorylase